MQSRGFRRRRLVLVMLTCAAAPPLQAQAGAQTQPATDAERGVRAVIQAQLDAFAADDAEQAFSFATPQLRQQFGDAQRFMAMVRSSYPAVYRPASVAFLKLEQADQQAMQAVQLTDTAGKAWLALYQMQRQADGSWRIAGCVIAANEGRST